MIRPRILRSTAIKGVVVYAFVAVALTVIFTTLVYENQLDLITENAYLRSMQTGLQLREELERTVAQGLNWEDDARELIESNTQVLMLTIFTDTGDILASTGRDDPETTDEELLMIHRSLTQRDFESRLVTHQLDRSDRLVTLFVPFEYPEARIGVLSLSVDLVSIDEWLGVLRRQATIVGGLVMLIHTLLALFAHRLFVAPLKHLVTATNSIAGGRYEVSLPERRDDEFGDLARSFRRMSHAVRQMHDEARSSNPLTGLPGNVEIERHIRHRMADERVFCVLYCDMDDFKAYNDTHGFARGDEFILFMKSCLVQAATQVAKLPVFIGHEGGDDFVAVTDFTDWQTLAEKIIELFEAGKSEFFDDESVARGYVMAEDRRGAVVKHELVSLSVAVVTNQHRPFGAFGEIVKLATEVKRLAKGQPGSCYALDRRQR